MSYSVLIIDDEPLICMGLLEIVNWKAFGFEQADIRFNFADGLKAALTHPYTLIVTDVRIHDDNGLEIIRRAKEAGTCENFILISAYAEFSYAQAAISYGVRDYILKPIDKEKLESSVRRFVEELKGKKGVPEREEQPEESVQSGGKESTHITNLLKYVHEHYNEPDMSLTSLAQKCYVNPSYLGQKFHQRTGIKFTDYLNQYRIIKACELLIDGKLLTYEVCERVGFGNATYFHRVFKKVTGYSTMEYKKRLLRGQVELPSLPKIDAEK